MHLDPRLGILVDERANAARLRARQELTDDATGREEDRIVVAGIVNRRTVIADVETRAAIRKIERSRALGNRVVAAGLEQPRRARMVG